jgi:hypothetical protein
LWPTVFYPLRHPGSLVENPTFSVKVFTPIRL